MNEEHLLLARRAVAAIASRAISRGDGVVFSARRGVYDGNAGMVHALFALAAVVPVRGSLLRAAARGLADQIAREPIALDGYGGVGSELEVLARWSPSSCEDLARGLLAQVDASTIDEERRPDLHGGACGALVALASIGDRARRQAPQKIAAALAEAIGGSLTLGEVGLAAAAPRTRRPLVGLTHGASGIAWTIDALLPRGLGRAIATSLRSYVDHRSAVTSHGWPDDRASGDPSATTAFCHGSLGIALAARADRAGDLVRARATRHLLAEAAAGGTGALAPCHGDPGTMLGLARWGQRDAALRLAESVGRSLLEPGALDDLERGLFGGSLGAVVALIELGSSGAPIVPWLPRANEATLPELESPLVEATFRAAFPATSSRATPEERALLLHRLADEGSSGLAACALRREARSALDEDLDASRHRWSFRDDDAVARAVAREIASGRSLAAEPLDPALVVRKTARLRFADHGHLVFEHGGMTVTPIELDDVLASVLARASRPTPVASLVDLLPARSRSGLTPEHALRGLLARGWLVKIHEGDVP